jgi:hypothetical protein
MEDLGSEAGDGIDVGDEGFVVGTAFDDPSAQDPGDVVGLVCTEVVVGGDLAGDPLVDRSGPPGRRLERVDR